MSLKYIYRKIHIAKRDREHEMKRQQSQEWNQSVFSSFLFQTKVFCLKIAEKIFRLMVIVFHEKSVAYDILYTPERVISEGVAFDTFSEHHTKVRVFSFWGGITIVATSVLVALFLNITTGLYNIVEAATYTWSQTAWNTLSSNTTGHPAPGNWTEYSATTTGISAGTDVSLLAISSTSVQTSDVDFNSGTFSGTATSSGSVGLTPTNVAVNNWDTVMKGVPGVVGDGGHMIRNGSDDAVYVFTSSGGTGFYRYSISANSWTTLTPIPGGLGSGAQVIRNGADNDIYVLRGNTSAFFYKYSISGNSWTTLTSAPVFAGAGAQMIRNGADNDIYVTRGAGQAAFTFFRYSISANTWALLTNVPGVTSDGSQMIRNGADNDIYVLQGNSGTGFYKYSISGNSWTTLTVVPSTMLSGSQMIRNGADNDIYILSGAGSISFYKYSISGNSWTILTSIPSSGGSGEQMIRNASDNDIYVLQGGSQTGSYKYSISGNSWTTLTVVPGTTGLGSQMVRNASDNDIYVLQGNSLNGFYKYSISGNSWTGSNVSNLTAVPGTVSIGAQMIRNGSDNTVYVAQGNIGLGTGFYKYSISGNSWTTLTASPAVIGAGAKMIRNASDNDIYVLAGAGNTGFYKYSISGNSWTTLTVVPVAVGSGGQMIRNSSDNDIYVLPGNTITGFYKYSISGNSWTTLTVVPGTTQLGAQMIRNASDNDIYVLQGNNSTSFYKYSISGNSWATLTPAPAVIYTGSQMIRNGADNDIYVVQGSATGFYKYSISGNSWITLAVVPGSVSSGSQIIRNSSDDSIYFLKGSAATGFYKYSISGNSWITMVATPSTVSWGAQMIRNGADNEIYVLSGNSTTSFYKYIINSTSYSTSPATYTSPIIDMSASHALTTVTYSTTLNSQTLTIDVGAGDTVVPDGTWTWLTGVANGADISSFTGKHYVQYIAHLTSANANFTPLLNDLTVNFNTYLTNQSLTGSPFNTFVSGNVLGNLSWNETLAVSTYVGISVRAGTDATALNSASWSAPMSATSTGCAKVGTLVTCLGSDSPELAPYRTGSGTQWFQYKIVLSSLTGVNTPTVSDITMKYVVNAPPELQNVTATENADGTVTINYEVRDRDTNTGTLTPGSITPSFSYSTNSGGSWTNITSALATDATTTKTVSTTLDADSLSLGWTSYSTTWTPKDILDGLYNTTFQIRVTANDNEGSNNTVSQATTDFTLDIKDPTLTSNPVLINNATAPATITLNTTDNSTLSMKVGKNPSLSDAPDWIAFASTTTLTLTAMPATVYAQFKDAFGNTTTIQSVTTPQTPQNVVYRDLSNPTTDPPDYRIFVSWAPVPVSGNGFGSYKIYRSTDGTNYSFFQTITNRNLNYIVDGTVGAYLDPSITYSYKVYAEDIDGNTSYFTTPFSHAPSGQGGTDVSPPVITDVNYSAGTQTATISWFTDEFATSQVTYCLTSCSSNPNLTQPLVTNSISHEVILSGLTPSTLYQFFVTSVDLSANSATSSLSTFTTNSGPVITNVIIPKVNNTTADIEWTTDISADSLVYYAPNTPPTVVTQVLKEGNTGATTHNVTLTGLTPATPYYFYVMSSGGENRRTVNGINEYYSFSTSDDSVPPLITNIATSTVTDVEALIKWTTNEPATSLLEYGTTTGSYSSSTALTTLDLDHGIVLSNLLPSSRYYYRITATDSNGNLTTSAEYNFVTLENQFGESERIINVVTNVTSSGGARMFSDMYNASQSVVDDLTQKLADVTNALSKKTKELTDALAELADIKKNILGVGENEVVSPKELLKIVTEKFVSLTKVFQSGTDVGLSESDINPIVKTLRDLASAVPGAQVKGEPKVEISNGKVVISWTTDKDTSSVVAFSKDTEYDSTKDNPYSQQVGQTDVFMSAHSVSIENLLPSTTYHFQIQSTSPSGNMSKTKDFVFTTPAQLPVISESRMERLDGNRVRLVWATNVIANSTVRYTPVVNGKMVSAESVTFGKPDFENTHSVILEALKPGTIYNLELISADLYGNTARLTLPNVSTGKDTTPPEITQVRTEVSTLSDTQEKVQVVVYWKTDELSTSKVYYEEMTTSSTTNERAGERPKNETTESLTLDNSHTVVIGKWRANTVYRFRTSSTDSSGNVTESKDFVVKTPQRRVSIIDIIISNFSSTFGWTKNLGI